MEGANRANRPCIEVHGKSVSCHDNLENVLVTEAPDFGVQVEVQSIEELDARENHPNAWQCRDEVWVA